LVALHHFREAGALYEDALAQVTAFTAVREPRLVPGSDVPELWAWHEMTTDVLHPYAALLRELGRDGEADRLTREADALVAEADAAWQANLAVIQAAQAAPPTHGPNPLSEGSAASGPKLVP